MRRASRRETHRDGRSRHGLLAVSLPVVGGGRGAGLLLSGGLGVGDEADERGFQVVGVALGHQPGRSVAGQHGPRVHQRDAVAAHGLVHEVGRDEDRHPLPPREVDEQLPELVAGDRIHAGRRLVQEQHLRLVHHRDRQRKPLPQPQREVLGGCVEVRRRPKRSTSSSIRASARSRGR